MECLCCTCQTNVTHINEKQYTLKATYYLYIKFTTDLNNTVYKGNLMFQLNSNFAMQTSFHVFPNYPDLTSICQHRSCQSLVNVKYTAFCTNKGLNT